jgi:short-subunit dehydrogenase
MDAKDDRSTSGWAIVTGASSGIGQAFALELARRGYPVLAVARRRDRLEALAAEAAAQGGRIAPLTADLTADAGVTTLFQRVHELDRVDLLVNNAGVATAGDFHETALEAQMASIRLNVDAVVRVTHEVLRVMLRDRRGTIINMASMVAFQPFPHFAVYAASKAFVLSFTEALAEEVKGTGVRLLAVCPGSARTEIQMFAQNEGLLGKFPSLAPQEIVSAALQASSAGRVVKVVGRLNGMVVFMNRLMPRSTVRWMMGVVAKSPSAGQSDAQLTRPG